MEVKNTDVNICDNITNTVKPIISIIFSAMRYRISENIYNAITYIGNKIITTPCSQSLIIDIAILNVKLLEN